MIRHLSLRSCESSFLVSVWFGCFVQLRKLHKLADWRQVQSMMPEQNMSSEQQMLSLSWVFCILFCLNVGFFWDWALIDSASHWIERCWGPSSRTLLSSRLTNGCRTLTSADWKAKFKDRESGNKKTQQKERKSERVRDFVGLPKLFSISIFPWSQMRKWEWK